MEGPWAASFWWYDPQSLGWGDDMKRVCRRNSIPSRLCTALAIACFCSASANVTVEAAPVKAAELRQKQLWLANLIVHYTPKHLRVDALSSGAIIVANAPQWQVQIYDPKRKLCYQASLTTFLDSGIVGPFQNTGLMRCTMAEEKAGIYAGAKARHYRLLNIDNGNSASGNYWIANDPGAVEPVCHILQALYRAPAALGIPLALDTDPNPELAKHAKMFAFAEAAGVQLTTSKSGTSTIDDTKFAYQGGFRRARFATDVIVDQSMKQNMEEGLKDFGLGE